MKISKKGQIVIPAHLRDRLNIQPGMHVNFRIRGQVLIVELETDIEQNIKYLRGVDLGKVDEGSARDIIQDLLHQQFYEGENKITDRIGKRVLTIRGADAILSEVLNILTHSSRFWMEGNPVESLRQYASDFDLDFPTVISRYSEKVRSMLLGGEDLIKLMGAEVMLAMAVGEALSQFRTRVGDMVTDSLFKLAQERGYVNRLGFDTVQDLITRSLADEYSILMNLRVLKELAKVNLKTVGMRKYNELAKEMLDSYDDLNTPDHVKDRRERREKRKSTKGSKKSKHGVPLEDERSVETTEDSENLMPELPKFNF